MWHPRKISGSNLIVLISTLCFFYESTHGLHCYTCSSDKLELCSTFNSLEELPTELCPTDVTSCFTKIKSGITYRGCLSPNEKWRIHCTDKSCNFCRSNKCNSQIFPSDRLSCIHCDGRDCVNQKNTIDVRYPCANYHPNDTCYSVFSHDGSTAYRGCASDKDTVGIDFCIHNSAQCSTCAKRACNDLSMSLEEKFFCVKCNPNEESNCNIVDEKTAAAECAPTTLGYKNECYTHRKLGGVTHRGCLFEAPEEIFDECSNVFSESCSTCNKTDCNRSAITNEELTVNPFHFEIHDEGKKTMFIPCDNSTCTKVNSWERYCFHCDSSTDPNCTDILDRPMVRLCSYAKEDLGCYHMITDEKTVRGCVVDIEDEAEKAKCLANDPNCKTCFGIACNLRKHFSTCYTTDTPFVKESEPYEFDTKSSPKECTNYVDKCFIQVLEDENETVIRGCHDDYIAQDEKNADSLKKTSRNKFYACTGPLCNEKRKADFCISCNSTVDPDCANSKSATKCPLEAVRSGCYHFANSTYVEKGCVINLDEDLRAQCKSDNSQNNLKCKRCFGNNCNERNEFLTCYSSGEADFRGLPKTCKNYDDECFVHASGDLIQRGCVSDVRELPTPIRNFANDCKNPAICERCKSNKCNDKMIMRERCLSCSSDVNGLMTCKYFPNKKKMSVLCPFTLGSGGCYLSLDEKVTRGCTSALETQKQSECLGSSDKCKTCKGENCNEKVEFQVCTHCSSETDGKACITGDARFNETQCPNYTDKCYIHLENRVVTRGCMDRSKTLTECDSDREHWAFYDNPNSNRLSLEAQTCFACDSSNNINCTNVEKFMNNNEYLEKCPLSLEDKGCYHYINSRTRRNIRGCVNTLSDHHLESFNKSPSDFKICKGPKCNSASSQYHQKCLVCNSADDLKCVSEPSWINGKTCESYKSRCFSSISSNKVYRGCLDDSEEYIREKCRKDSENCNICSDEEGSACNTNPVDMLNSCIECDSAVDERCRTKPEEFGGKICPQFGSPRRKGCYLSIVDNRVRRGCVQDLLPLNATDCLSNSGTCKTCPGKNCNTRTQFQECHTCTSTIDPQCAKIPKLTGTEVCKDYNSKCGTEIDQDANTSRKCIPENLPFKSATAKNYETCDGINCNHKIFPKDRLQCYQCNGEAACDLETSKKSLKPEACEAYAEYDQCFSYAGPDKNIYRGCLSDRKDSRFLCQLANTYKTATCLMCAESGCNDQPKIRQAKLSCLECDDEKECAFGQEKTKTTVCKKDVALGDEETCFIQSIKGTKKVKRGCTLDESSESDWCDVNQECTKCSEDGCNAKNVHYQWCVQCKSDFKGDCARASELDGLIAQCSNDNYPFSKRGCYTRVKDGKVTRGCIADLSDDDHKKCDDDKKSCNLCTDEKCNKNQVISSSLMTSASASLCSFIILVTFWLQIN